MGDRVLVTFKDSTGPMLSPAVYMHWDGGNAVSFVQAAAPNLRKNDSSYSAARFCAYACSVLPGNTGVGLADAPDAEDPGKCTHGDAGVLVVDVSSGELKAYGGYLSEHKLPNVDFPNS